MGWIRSSSPRQPEVRGAGALLRLAGAVVLSAMAIGLGGCWPFGRDSTPPQQQYFNALKLGNAAQASQLWLHMTPEERMKFERGQNIRPTVSPTEVQHAVAEHYAAQTEDGDNSDSSHLQLAPRGAGLQDLPAYLKEYRGRTGAPQSAPATAPAGSQ